MFVVTEPFLVFDYLRIPHRLLAGADIVVPAGLGAAVSEEAPERRLLWPSQAGGLLEREGVAGDCRFAGSSMFARVVPDAVMQATLGSGWHPDHAVIDRAGRTVGSVWRDDAGAACLPFDPAEAMVAFWSEAYIGILDGRHTPGPSRAVRLYYRIRPLVPRRIQISLRRAYAHRLDRAKFPSWPAEPAFHDLLRTLYLLAQDVAAEPLPWIAPWPSPYAWALVLTHDVETADGYARVGELQALESSLGYRAAWNFVAGRYDVDDGMLDSIQQAGGEVGLHGLYHDGRDLASRELLASRLPAMHEHAGRWHAVGFRSPATQRRWDLMPALGFDYDSSYPDTDPYEPQPGGSCSWLPYMIGDMVELPITLPQDHTLFVILKHADAQVWADKIALLRERGGMALLLTHPDYMGNDIALQSYRELLDAHAGDASVWRALPREVSAWWRRRAASSVVRDASGWRVIGPAGEEARISFEPPG